MDRTEEKAIFDRATEKLDLYVPLCIGDGCADDARKFLQPGGEYVRFAVKEFMKELRGKIIEMNMKHEYSKAAPYVTISQGGCFGIPAEGEKVESYLHMADDMLYRIKEVSRNNYQVCEYGK